jgi:hypothetical protein
MFDEQIESVGCGECHSIIVKRGGQVFGFGFNADGQLNLDEHGHSINTPTLCYTDNNIQTVYCTNFSTIILKKDNSIIIFGRSANIALALFQMGGLPEEIKVETISGSIVNLDIVSLSVRYNSIIIVKNTGEFVVATEPTGSISFQNYIIGKPGSNGYIHFTDTMTGKSWPKIPLKPTIILGSVLYFSWNPKNHIYFPTEFQETMSGFLLSLKRYKIKVPKYLIYMILNGI